MTRYAVDGAGNIHWFQGSKVGDGVRFHWSGQTNGFTKGGTPMPLDQDQIDLARGILGLKK